jgi:hypothetical protein
VGDRLEVLAPGLEVDSVGVEVGDVRYPATLLDQGAFLLGR